MGKKESIYLGVDYNSTKIRVGAISQDGRILKSGSFMGAWNTQAESLHSLENAIEAFLSDWEGPSFEGMGIGLSGHVNPEKGIWIRSINASIKAPVELRKQYTKKFNMPVFIDNDVHAATLAEIYLGIGTICNHFVLISLGEGIAAGIVSDRKLIRGVANSAGEFGHISVEPAGQTCPCGFTGCLENIIGSTRLLNFTVEKLPLQPDSVLNEFHRSGVLDVNAIFQAAADGDGLAEYVTNRAIKALGTAVVAVVNLLNPEHVVFAGSNAQSTWLIQQIHKFVYDNAFVSCLGGLRDITQSSLDVKEVGIVGAAYLCRYKND